MDQYNKSNCNERTKEVVEIQTDYRIDYESYLRKMLADASIPGKEIQAVIDNLPLAHVLCSFTGYEYVSKNQVYYVCDKYSFRDLDTQEVLWCNDNRIDSTLKELLDICFKHYTLRTDAEERLLESCGIQFTVISNS